MQKVDRSCVAAIADCPPAAVAAAAASKQGAGAGTDFVFDFVLTGHLIGSPVYGRLGPHTVLLKDAPPPSSTTTPASSGMTHTNEKLLIMTLKRLACHEVRINLEPRGMH